MNFTNIPKLIQWVISIGLCVIGWMTFSFIDAIWHLIFIVVLIPWLHFCVTPLFHLLGIYQYLSPPVFVFNPSDQKYDLHNGNLIDYLQVFSRKKSNITTQKYILKNYANSCLQIISKIKRGELPNTVQIVGYSYFFNKRTASKLSFKIGKIDAVTKFFFYLNLIEIIILYSFVKGSWEIPKLWEAKLFYTTGEALCKKEQFIEKILKKLD